MNGKKLTILTVMIITIVLVSATAACARGNSEVGQPEPVEVKASLSGADEANTGQDYPPEGWVTDITEAYRLAQNGDRNILINFTGSDWCVWCKKLSKEVFTTDEFRAYAEHNLVLLFVDFPQAVDIPPEQIRHNQIMAQLLGVQGYPTIWLLGSDLSPLLSTGYRDGGADEYIRHLKNDRPEISASELEAFRTGITDAIEANIGPLNQP